jgi:hypothetical protein
MSPSFHLGILFLNSAQSGTCVKILIFLNENALKTVYSNLF